MANLRALAAHERGVVVLKIYLREIKFEKSEISFCKFVYVPDHILSITITIFVIKVNTTHCPTLSNEWSIEFEPFKNSYFIFLLLHISLLLGFIDR